MDLVHVSNVYNLTLKGQGQWPVTGAEETVMQSTVIINCIREKGGFYFTTTHSISVEGLTIVNCGGLNNAVFNFSNVQSLFFHKNSIQHMTGYGLFVINCENVIITNCSYYHSAVCNFSDSSFSIAMQYGGGVGIVYDTQYSNTDYTLELSYSNMTKCCNNIKTFGGGGGGGGGGVYLQTQLRSGFYSVKMVLSHLILSYNSANWNGGNLAALLKNYRYGVATLTISNCLFSRGHAGFDGGGMYFEVNSDQSSITIQNTDLVENFNGHSSELYYKSFNSAIGSLSLINSTILHTEKHSDNGVRIDGCCPAVTLTNTRMRLTKQRNFGFYITSDDLITGVTQMNNCQFEGCQSVGAILYLKSPLAVITNCTFSNNTGDHSVILIDPDSIILVTVIITNSTISDNNMTAITIMKGMIGFKGRNVIQNNRNTKGAGIKLSSNAYIIIDGELFL